MAFENKKYEHFEEVLLIADDDIAMREFIAEFAKSVGLKFKIAIDGKEALQLLQHKDANGNDLPVKEKYFLVLSDYGMPEMNGLELCIEARKIYQDLPFILISGLVDKSVALSGFKAGITSVIEKPVRLDTLRGCVLKYADDRIKRLEEEQRESEEIAELFVEEARGLLEDLEHHILKLEEESIDRATIDLLFRNVHSVKGGAAAVPGCHYLAQVTHAFESCLSLVKNNNFHPDSNTVELFLFTSDITMQLIHLIKERKEPDHELKEKIEMCLNSLNQVKERELNKSQEFSSDISVNAKNSIENAENNSSTSNVQLKPVGASSANINTSNDNDGVLVSNDKLESFMKLSGEMIVLKNYFKVLTQDPEFRGLSARALSKITDFSYSLNKITDHLQDKIMSVRKVSLDRALNKLPRIFRQVTKELNKKVNLNTDGFDLGVDKTIANVLSACMTHMLRNAIDHGIETSDVRIERGKPSHGTINIFAREEKGVIYLTISDDGGGINKERVLNKAIEKGFIDVSQKSLLSDAEAFDLLFLPGFSTAEKVTEISGRGVGMDVVKSEITNIGGRIKIDSVLGIGTTFNIEIPVPKTVLVEQTVLVKSGRINLAVPLNSIAYLSSLSTLTVNWVGPQKTFQFQNRTVALRSFSELVSRKPDVIERDLSQFSVVVLQHKSRYLGLLVNGIHDQLEAVIRPFDSISNHFPGFKGTTVLGDDSIAYVVAPDEFVQLGLDEERVQDVV